MYHIEYALLRQSFVRADSPHTNNIFIYVILNIITYLRSRFIGHSPIMSRHTTTIGTILIVLKVLGLK